MSKTELYVVTRNQDKQREITALMPEHYSLKTLRDLNFNADIPEEQNTLEGNARQKARHIYERFAVNCFADDTGLEVEALDGAPGVYSARYAGPNAQYHDNVLKLLQHLDGLPADKRKAQFRTVICLLLNDKEYLFEGTVDGQIITELRGDGKFGYDPVFLPDGYEHTFAQMTQSLKNSISHRGRTLRKMIDFLSQNLD